MSGEASGPTWHRWMQTWAVAIDMLVGFLLGYLWHAAGMWPA